MYLKEGNIVILFLLFIIFKVCVDSLVNDYDRREGYNLVKDNH